MLRYMDKISINSNSLGVSVFTPVVKDRNFSLIPLSTLNLIIKFKNVKTLKKRLSRVL